ncbi:MerR family transcriptional regulator [Nocardia sp. NPDC050793]|uniref:MerR family transcriptional regulator n=1 Tax=Nocardia sp. NPDC050793 TaxID=3155159 RepID=UPI0033EE8D35
MAADMEYTIDELARAAGTTVRSLRVYHERGVLPPPDLKGRTGYYSPDHLNRVRTISRLLDRGIKLNGIKELLKAWDRGDDLGDVLGVGIADSSSQPQTEKTISASELEQLYREVPDGLIRLVALGLYDRVDTTTYRLVDPRLAEIADHLIAAGIAPAAAIAELEHLRADADRIARRFVGLLEPTVTAADGGPDDARIAPVNVGVRAVAAQATAELVDRYITRYVESRGLSQA